MIYSRLLRPVLCAALLTASPVLSPVWAKPQVVQIRAEAEISGLSQVLKIPEILEVMRQEGVDYGTEMEAEMFPGKGGAPWAAVVGLIYDGPSMLSRFETAFAQQLAGREAEIAEMETFFGSDLGQRILTLEVEARRSLMDEAVEDAAKARAEDMEAAGEPRFADLQKFAEVNDLIEANISGALNSNLAFFQGLAEVGALSEDMTEADMLSDVWSQEPEIRAETEAWVYPYLALAYGPLTDEEMAAYLQFSETDAGQVLNSALFTAFDVLFRSISRDLGRAAAKQMMGEDI
ncbi:DUF2059 domain-containing protein [Pseudorhodobacter sp. E13]|uniref:DUF2059 domain-containing protein n=1 Tax=Pseudorhodobacter sp. E13 TaxID=2487931 RepID=UPI000F8ECB64|nr:DUF2059 domain-containing protein [Pseudorhodobacter sp. E13]RUS60937.1 DUF2059 domain-containing protein [Pseudorhodobacter sp. E13]